MTNTSKCCATRLVLHLGMLAHGSTKYGIVLASLFSDQLSVAYERVHPHIQSAGTHLSEQRCVACAGVGNNKFFALTIVGTSPSASGGSRHAGRCATSNRWRDGVAQPLL
jgi:hypothetical protein